MKQEKGALLRLTAVAIAALILAAWSNGHCQVDRDDAAPICYVDDPVEVWFAAEQVTGLYVRVVSQKGPYPRAEEIRLYPCWWDTRQDVSIPICPVAFSPVIVSSQPGTGDTTVWMLWVGAYLEGETTTYGPETPCLDYENPDGAGNPDAIFAWHQPIQVTGGN